VAFSIEARGARGYVDAGDTRLSYLDYGEGQQSVVIVPGITSPAMTWDFVAVELAATRRVVVLDVRGRGHSDKPDAGYTLPIYAADTAALIETLELDDCVVLGHSMGARIATALGVLRPGAAGALVVVDPPLTGPGRDPYPTSLESFKQQLEEGYRGTTPDEIRRFYPRWSERELQVRCEWLPTCHEPAVVETHLNFEREEFFELWSQLPPPVLFVYGEESPAVPPSAVAEIRASNRHAEVVGIAGAGHMIPWENLGDFLTAVERFLASLD
jgi:N-formylmaleamate deformylase